MATAPSVELRPNKRNSYRAACRTSRQAARFVDGLLHAGDAVPDDARGSLNRAEHFANEADLRL